MKANSLKGVIREGTLAKTRSFFSDLKGRTMHGYVPWSEACFAISSKDDPKNPVIMPLDRYHGRAGLFTYAYRYDILLVADIEGVKCVKWNDEIDVNEDLILEICTVWNNEKNHNPNKESKQVVEAVIETSTGTATDSPIPPHLLEVKVEDMTDRELLVAILEKENSNEARLINLEKQWTMLNA